MYVLTNAPAHLLIQVSPERIGIEADPDVESLRNEPLPTALVIGDLTKITCATGYGNRMYDFVRMLSGLGYTTVTMPDYD